MSTSGTGNAVPVAGLTGWTLNMPTDRVDVTAQGDTNKQWLQGLPDKSGDFAGWWENDQDILFAANDSADGVKMYLYPNTAVLGKYFYGPAWVDASLNSPVGGAVGVSGTFAANGPWGRQ